eukprot:scaffold2011_cov233-Pinguiococcus_pyrenoidosus.AAC.9
MNANGQVSGDSHRTAVLAQLDALVLSSRSSARNLADECSRQAPMALFLLPPISGSPRSRCLEDDLEREDLEREDLEKEDLEKEDLEKEDLEKEDLEKEDLEKEDLEKDVRKSRKKETKARRTKSFALYSREATNSFMMKLLSPWPPSPDHASSCRGAGCGAGA